MDLLIMSPEGFAPLFSISDKMLASNVKEATLKKKSRTPSPGVIKPQALIGAKAATGHAHVNVCVKSHLTLPTQPSTPL